MLIRCQFVEVNPIRFVLLKLWNANFYSIHCDVNSICLDILIFFLPLANCDAYCHYCQSASLFLITSHHIHHSSPTSHFSNLRSNKNKRPLS
ncbi:hypothetical protein RIF29_28945 [Crotalaria pallida]|uniref:Uncharacterized protein n=1 Tax=Crotalaria pallida TaxID=3830 RepID=A0AAN9HVG9_CROPI